MNYACLHDCQRELTLNAIFFLKWSIWFVPLIFEYVTSIREIRNFQTKLVFAIHLVPLYAQVSDRKERGTMRIRFHPEDSG